MKLLITVSFLLSTVLPSMAQNFTKISECVVENGELKTIIADYNPQNGEKSLVIGGVRKKLGDIYPLQGKDYAAGQLWFINNETVLFNGKPYVKYGLPRILGVTEIVKVGLFNAVGVYREAGTTGIPEVIYIPVRQGCEFQPYQLNCKKLYIEEAGKASSSTMSFTAKITDEPGKIIYSWESPGVPIKKGQGTNTITVDTKDKKEEDEFGLVLYASIGQKCWLATDHFAVKKITRQQTQVPHRQ